MSPRLLETRRCPHCHCELSAPVPRTCPECGGSLQKRYLASGCLTNKPTLVLLAAAAALFLAQRAGSGAAEPGPQAEHPGNPSAPSGFSPAGPR